MYVGVLDGAGDVWGVRIPDCPGAYGARATPEAALTSAISGLTAWTESARKDGISLPAEIAASEDAPGADEALIVVSAAL